MAVRAGLFMRAHFSSEVICMSEKISIKHVLADGRKIDSIDGFVIPETGPTAAVYRIAADFARKHKQTAPKEVKNATA